MAVKPPISAHGFGVGDMVWAKMKSQPWWPGHVYSEEFATPLVRQSKREGLLLVAFFGASSYAWFDSSQLIPFDSNYAEKSLQIGSGSFVRAVEDAIEEVRRRIGLGLCCMCRNKQNFMKIDVQGFVSVDVEGYDPGAVYSIDAIGKARDSFKPKLTLDFLRQLALEPTVSEHVDIDFVKNKATVMAYRKAVYEDFDQAFGYDPVRASSSKAPLSGREVFAFKDPTIAAGVEDATGSTKDPLPTVFKSNNLYSETSTSIVDSPASSAVAEVDQAKVMKVPQNGDGKYETELSQLLGDLCSLAVDPFNMVNRGSRVKVRKAFLRFRSLVFQKGKNFSLQQAGGEPNASKSSEDTVEVPPVKPQSGPKRGPSDRQEEMAAKKKKKVDDIRSLVIKIDKPPARDVKQAVATTLKKPGPELIKKTEKRAPELSMLMIEFPHGGSLPSFNELKARFARYGPMDHSATQIHRNTFSCRVVFRHKVDAQAAYRFVVGSSSLFGNTGVKCSLKEVGDVGAAEHEPLVKIPKEDHQPPAMEERPPSLVAATSGVQPNSILKIPGGEEAAGDGGGEAFADSLDKVISTAKPKDHVEKEDTDLSRVLSDLHSLAVDPFNTVNRGSRVKGKKAFLRFRSLVFQKRQNFLLPAAGELNASKFLEESVEVPFVKQEGGLKRGPSDREEEMAAAKRKKAGDIRNLTKEKKVIKIDKPTAQDVKLPVAMTLKKPGTDVKRATGPTMLMIKFPKGGSLPSFKELKARFARYGPMDHSGTHIFWNTFSCQVVFKHKAHAQAAYRFVIGSSSLFGNTGVKCSLKEVGIMGSAEPEPLVKVPKEDHHQPDTEGTPPPSMVPDTSGVELKSILKKSGGEEAAGNGGRGRVKFMLGGESQMENNMENKTSNSTMDFDKNFQKAVDPGNVTSPTGPSPPPPLLHHGTTLLAPPSLPPLPPRFMQTTPLRVPNRLLNATLMTPNTDIGQQMLSLLARCNDVVMNVSRILGYTPYHPL